MRSTFVVALILIAPTAYAADPVAAPSPEPSPIASPSAKPTPHGYLSGLVGPAFVTSGGDGTHLAWAGRAGIDVIRDENANYSLGIYIGGLSSHTAIEGVSLDESVIGYAAELLERNIQKTGFYSGLRVGAATLDATVAVGNKSSSISDTDFMFSPVLGIDIHPVNYDKTRFTLEASYVTILGGTVQVNGVSTSYEATNALLIQGGLTIQF